MHNENSPVSFKTKAYVIQCCPSFQEFHEMSHGLLLWLENIDRRRNEVVPIPPQLDRDTLRAHYKTLTVRLSSTRFVQSRLVHYLIGVSA